MTDPDFKVADLSLAEFGRKEIRLAELGAQGHEAWHLVFGETNFFTAELG